MFVEHPSKKKGMERPGKSASRPSMMPKDTMAGYSKLDGKKDGKNSMEHCSRLLGGKALEPKVPSHYFGDPKDHHGE